MPYTITMESAFLRIVFSGVVTNQELQLFADELEAIERRSAVTPHRLSDFSAMTAPHFGYLAVRALLDRRKALPVANPIKAALIAPRPIQRGIARMFQILHEHPDIAMEIFSTVEAAEAWLRVE